MSGGMCWARKRTSKKGAPCSAAPQCSSRDSATQLQELVQLHEEQAAQLSSLPRHHLLHFNTGNQQHASQPADPLLQVAT